VWHSNSVSHFLSRSSSRLFYRYLIHRSSQRTQRSEVDIIDIDIDINIDIDIQRSQVLPMISRQPSILRTSLCLLLLICGSSYHLTVALASSLSPKSSSTSIDMGELAKTSMRNDAAAYNEFVSAAVDLSDAHVSKDGLFTGM
jgi:hypothetical protein